MGPVRHGVRVNTVEGPPQDGAWASAGELLGILRNARLDGSAQFQSPTSRGTALHKSHPPNQVLCRLLTARPSSPLCRITLASAFSAPLKSSSRRRGDGSGRQRGLFCLQCDLYRPSGYEMRRSGAQSPRSKRNLPRGDRRIRERPGKATRGPVLYGFRSKQGFLLPTKNEDGDEIARERQIVDCTRC